MSAGVQPQHRIHYDADPLLELFVKFSSILEVRESLA